MMKLSYERASCHVESDFIVSGSVLKGTVQVTWKGFRTHLAVESSHAPEEIAKLIRNAKRGCIGENLVVQQVPLHSTAELNGESLNLETILQ